MVWIKHDDQTSQLYGGNKVRKLEYIFERAIDRGAKRVATFGAVGSNHALATALFAKQLGLGCTCFLGHQRPTPYIPGTLYAHLAAGTELVQYGAGIDHLQLFRKYLQGRDTWVIPIGGTTWLGVVGFINAALELAAQIEAGEVTKPERIYIANGTMGSVAGLAIGFALANLPIDLHAVRVAASQFAYPQALQRIIRKTVTLLHRLDASIPDDVWRRTSLTWRDEFYAGGYAATDDATNRAVSVAQAQLGIKLETTYTGKAMAALLADLSANSHRSLFWNTYNSNSLPSDAATSANIDSIPQEFLSYLGPTDTRQN